MFGEGQELAHSQEHFVVDYGLQFAEGRTVVFDLGIKCCLRLCLFFRAVVCGASDVGIVYELVGVDAVFREYVVGECLVTLVGHAVWVFDKKVLANIDHVIAVRLCRIGGIGCFGFE
jgi:hypothetical protein